MTVFAQCPTITDSSQSFCDIDSPTISSLAAINNGGGVQWYATATSTTPLSPTSGLVNGEDYFADSSAGTCGIRPSVTVTIYSAPTGQNFQGVCVGVASDATIADLIANGNNVRWFSTPNNGTPLSSSTILNDNTIYYASQTNPETGCETSRLSVFVNVGVVPVPTGDSTQQFCNDPNGPAPTVGDLVATGANNWYLTSSSAVPLAASTPLINGQSYFATTVDPPCESTTRFEVVVTLVEPNDAGTNGALSICQNQVNTTPPVNLFTLLGGTPDQTGTWSGPVATSNGFQGALNLSSLTSAGSPYIFTYNVTGLCAPDSSTVTITVLPTPTAAVSANATICSGSSSVVTFNGTPNSTVTYNVNGGANQTIVLNGSGTATINNTYTATTTFNLVSVASATAPSCVQPLSGSITITVVPLPTAAIAANATICSGNTATVTFTGTPNSTVSYTVNGGAAQTIVLNASGVATITNSYSSTTVFSLVSVTSSGTPSCTRPLTGTVTITVIPPPTASISGSISVCPGNPATVTFSGTPGATVTYSVNGGPNQTLILNSSGTGTLTNTYSATTTITLVSVTTSGTPSCSQPVSGSVTITVLPLPTASIAANTTVCAGASATVTFTGTPNATVTYTVNGGANQTILLNGSGSATLTATYNATTVYTLVSAASSGTPSCSNPISGSITVSVVPLPVVSLSSNTSICSGSAATVTFTGTPNAVVTYTVNGGSAQTVTLNSAGTATITGTYTATTVFSLVSAATAGSPACSQPQTGSMTITVIPPPTASVSANPTTSCSGGNATLTFTGTPNATVFYTINGGPAQSVILNGSGTATVAGAFSVTTVIALVSATTSGTPSCSAPLSGSVTITVLPLPTATITANATVCSGSTATVNFSGTPNATVTYTVNGGSNQTIVLNGSGTAAITGTFTTTTVYSLVSVASAGTPSCSQPVTGQITITVVPLPTAAISGNASVCSGVVSPITFTGTPNAIVTYSVNGGPNQTITLNSSGSATLSNPYTSTTVISLISATTAGTPACVQPLSGSVTITVISPPTVSISGTATICVNASATITFAGTPNATVTFSVNGGPNQTITLDSSGSATITGTYDQNTTFSLISVSTATAPVCTQTMTGSATITVTPLPVASIAASQTICSGNPATVTFTGTPNAVVVFTVNGTQQSITLDSAGSASITSSYTATTVFSLVSITTAGSPGCSQTISGSVTITVIPPPTASISSDATVCPGGSAVITFSGTPNSQITYTVNGVSQTIILNASGTASTSGVFNQTTVFELQSVSLSDGSCPQPLNGSVTITVIPFPIATISATTANICSGSSASVIITGTPDATVSYTVNGGTTQTVILDASGNAILTPMLSATSVFTLVSAATSGTPSCVQTLSGSVSVTVTQPPTAGSDVALVTFCQNGPATDLFSLLGTATPGGAWTPALASGAGVFDPAVDSAGTYIYSVPANGPCPGDIASVTVSIILPPNAGQDAATQICTTGDALDLFTLLGPSAQTGGTWTPILASGTGNFDPAVDTAGSYTYTVTGSAPCGNDSAVVSVSVVQGPNAGNDALVSLCANAAPQDLFAALGASAQAGGTWSPTLASGTGIFNPAVDSPGGYTYTVNGIAICTPDSAAVTVVIVTPPNAGADAVLNTCSNADAQNIFLLLNGAEPGGVWSPSLSGGNIFDPAIDPAGIYTYTVSGTSPCANDSATVTVTVTPGPDAGQDGSMTVCTDSPSQNLFDFLEGTPQPGGTWTPALSGGNGIFDPSVDQAGVYTYTFFGNQPCDNDTATVTVTVNPVPDAGEDGTAFFCTNYPPDDLFNSLTGNPQPGGTWTPALASGTGIFNPLVDPAGTYTYSVGGGLCSTDTASVVVTVTQSPNAGGNGATLLINSCVTQTSVDLFDGLNGSQGVGTWADDDSTGALSGSIFNASQAGAGTYQFTYTVGGGVSPCLFDSATVTVVVAPVANAGTFTAAPELCTSGGTFDLSTLLSGAPLPGGTWTDAASNPVANPIDLSTLIAGTNNFTYTVSNSCGTDSETVQLTILPVPSLTIPNITIITPICIGEDATLALSGMADGQYEITYNLSGANISPNQTVAVTVVAGASAFAIPSTLLQNTGTTTITFSNITNTATNCSSALSNVLINLVVRPTTNLDSVNLSTGNGCEGQPMTVTISNAIGLPDGTYQFNYSLSGASTSTGSTGIVAISAGSGQFSIAGTSFSVPGNYTLTITGIISLSGNCTNLSENATAEFEIFAAPNSQDATIAIADTCVNFDATVEISAPGLTDGTYDISYQLSGASTATNTVSVQFTSGVGTFVIPSAGLFTGTTTLTVTQLLTSPGACGADVTNFAPVDFEVGQGQTPTLEPQGDEFCGLDSPTLADLSLNIASDDIVIWYDTANSGNILPATTALQDGQTYFAAIQFASGCESTVRLPVTVDLNVCPEDILIPDGFSPNGDGINDDFEIVNLPELYPKFKLEIYNRYGSILYKGNANTPNWDGTASEGGLKVGNGVVPAGVYFYILEFNDGERKPQQGRLYLSR